MDRQRLSSILTLGMPIVGGMLSQNLLNLVDTAMVGRLGPAALGAVGIGGFATYMVITLVMGLAAGGVQAMASRRMGEGRGEVAAEGLNGGLLLAFLIGIPVSAFAIWLTPIVFPFLNGDPQVIEAGVPYVQIRMVSITAVAINMAFRGYWNGVSMPRMYLRTIVVIHITNAILDYVLIFGKFGAPALGTFGAGLASCIATALGAAYYFVLAGRFARGSGFLVARPSRETLETLLRLGVPMAVQQFSFFLGFTILFWIVGLVGTRELGVATVLINVMLVAILPGIGLGLAAATLAGRALGAGDPDDAMAWGWDVARVSMGYATGIAIVFLALTEPVLAIFIDDPAMMDLAKTPLRIVGATLLLELAGIVLANALQGVGDTRRVLVASLIMQWGFMLPAVYFVGPVAGYGITGIWIVLSAWRSLQLVCYGWLWHTGGWVHTRV